MRGVPFAPFSAKSASNRQPRETFMAIQRTFSIIKPDATRRNLTGKINAVFEEKGLRIKKIARQQIAEENAQLLGILFIQVFR